MTPALLPVVPYGGGQVGHFVIGSYTTSCGCVALPQG